jgi:hypothetical protein
VKRVSPVENTLRGAEMMGHGFKVIVACSLALFAFAASAPAACAQAQAHAFVYCKADAQRLCAGIQPGGGRIAKCLKAHENEVSIGCAKELKKIKSQMGK